METTTINYTNKVKNLGRFFTQTNKGAYTFVVADDELLQQNINQNLLQLAANKNTELAVVNIKTLSEKDKAPIAALRQYISEHPNLNGLIITNLYGLWLSKQYPDLLTQLNFVREEILKLNLPILFWVNDEMLPLLIRHAKDLYDQRYNFNLYFAETAHRKNELQADQYVAIERSKVVKDKKEYESRLKLLFKQLETAEKNGEDKVDIANDIIIEILYVYNNLPLMSPAFLRLFEEYESHFNKDEPSSNFIIAFGLKEANKLNKALTYYEVTLKLYRNQSKNNLERYLTDVADTLNNLGELQRIRNEFDKAEKSYSEALKEYHELAKINPSTFLPFIAGTSNNLGILHQNNNEFNKAEKAYVEALKIRRSLAEINRQLHLPYVAQTLNNLGLLQMHKSELAKSEKSFSETLEIYRELAEINPQTYLSYLALTLNNLGLLQRKKNEFEKAEKSYLEALEIRRKLTEVNPEAHLPDLAASLHNLGILKNDKNEFHKVENFFFEALEMRKELAKTNPSAFEIDLAQTHISLSQFFRYNNRDPDRSLRHAKAATTLYAKYAATVPSAKKWLQRAEENIQYWKEQA